jgi:hypothetical protein
MIRATTYIPSTSIRRDGSRILKYYRAQAFPVSGHSSNVIDFSRSFANKMDLSLESASSLALNYLKDSFTEATFWPIPVFLSRE